jgi:phage gp36-like protein
MYCTIQDIRGMISDESLIQLVDDSGCGLTMAMVVRAVTGDNLTDLTAAQQAAAPIAAAAFAEIIENASGTVDGFSAGRYVTPWNPVPVVIKTIALDIAVYNLYSRRENVPELRKERHTNAMKLLDRLAQGKLTIGAGQVPQPTAGGAAAYRSRTKIFDSALMDTF